MREFVIDLGGIGDEAADFLAHQITEAMAEQVQQLAEVSDAHVELFGERGAVAGVRRQSDVGVWSAIWETTNGHQLTPISESLFGPSSDLASFDDWPDKL